jgi:hypothetical protein
MKVSLQTLTSSDIDIMAVSEVDDRHKAASHVLGKAPAVFVMPTSTGRELAVYSASETFRAVDILVLKIKDRMVSGEQTIHPHRVDEGSVLCRHR